jgi:aminoglycoside phosphotransferase
VTESVVDPLIAEARAVRRLSGLSGARVYMMTRDERTWFVRKGAATVEHNDRLRRQARKQAALAGVLADVVGTPPIFDEGTIDGRYYFDMELVQGVDAATYLRISDYDSVRRFTARLCDYLRAAAERPPLVALDATQTLFDYLYSRVCDVQTLTAALSPEVLSGVLVGLDQVRAAADPQMTLSHGDLTLENIVVDHEGRLWLLDLLDAPFESYRQDVAKLHQDLDGGWYLRRQGAIARCVGDYVGTQVFQTAVRLDPAYAALHPLLMAATFIRIIPYVADADSRRFVLERVAHYTGLIRR